MDKWMHTATAKVPGIAVLADGLVLDVARAPSTRHDGTCTAPAAGEPPAAIMDRP